VAVASSCAASKEYSSKLFAPRNAPETRKDSEAITLRFLDLDKVEPDQENWVTTDIIMGRDTSSKTVSLDKLTSIYPATPLGKPVKKDSIGVDKDVKTESIMTEAKTTENPVIRSYTQGEVRTKKSRTDK
jgi:hypothetical protein